MFIPLQIITGEAHAHTHAHTSLMKTTFVLSWFVLLHNKKNSFWLKAALLTVERETHVLPITLLKRHPAGISCLHFPYREAEGGSLSLVSSQTPTLVCHFANVISVCPCSAMCPSMYC